MRRCRADKHCCVPNNGTSRGNWGEGPTGPSPPHPPSGGLRRTWGAGVALASLRAARSRRPSVSGWTVERAVGGAVGWGRWAQRPGTEAVGRADDQPALDCDGRGPLHHGRAVRCGVLVQDLARVAVVGDELAPVVVPHHHVHLSIWRGDDGAGATGDRLAPRDVRL